MSHGRSSECVFAAKAQNDTLTGSKRKKEQGHCFVHVQLIEHSKSYDAWLVRNVGYSLGEVVDYMAWPFTECISSTRN